MRRCDPGEVCRAWSVLFEPGQITEVRILHAKSRYKSGTWAGWFDSPEVLIRWLEESADSRANQFSGWTGVYVIPNVVNPALKARRYNNLDQVAREEKTTTDGDVVARRWLLFDLDPKRPAGISSTDAEHELSITTARAVAEAMLAEGWPAPILADSGNGAHLLWRCDLPSAAAETDLIKRWLHAMAARFGTPGIDVDTAVFNPSRIWKLYGTLACKGEHLAGERPWRLARLLEVPTDVQVVPRGAIEAVAGPVAEPAKPVGVSRQGGRDRGQFDPVRFITDLGYRLGPEKTLDKGGRSYELAACVCERKGPGCALTIAPSGAVGLVCQHANCEYSKGSRTPGQHWKAFREAHDPDYGKRSKPRQERHAPPPEESEDSFRATVLAALPDAPVSEAAMVPKGWMLSEKGVFQLRTRVVELEPQANPVRVGLCPFVVEAILLNADTDTSLWQVAWRNESLKAWRRAPPQPAANLVKPVTLTELANYGAPLDQGSAKHLVGYLNAYVTSNGRAIPLRRFTTQIGWRKEGFLLGPTFVPFQDDADPIECRNEGARTFVAACVAEGEEQLERVQLGLIADKYPGILALIGISLSSALLHPLRANPYTALLTGRSGKGKTKGVQVAMSVWGAAFEGLGPTLKQTWNATRNAIVASINLSNGVPIFLDDLQHAKDPGVVSEVIYDQSSGQGRARLDRTGQMRAVPMATTVVIATGEHAVLREARERGAHARALELRFQPWGGESEAIGRDVDAISVVLRDHHGHTGLAWVRHIVTHHPEWSTWATRWREHVRTAEATIRKRASKADLATISRLACHVGLIEVALRLAAEAGVLHAETEVITAAVALLVEEAGRSLYTCDPGLSALQTVAETALQQIGLFFDPDCPSSERRPPRDGGWCGRLDHEYLAVTETWLRGVFRAQSLGNASSALDEWAKAGIVDGASGGERRQRQFRIGNGVHAPRARLWAIRLDRLCELTGVDLSGLGEVSQKTQNAGANDVQ